LNAVAIDFILVNRAALSIILISLFRIAIILIFRIIKQKRTDDRKIDGNLLPQRKLRYNIIVSFLKVEMA
jgi:hypothetical protein